MINKPVFIKQTTTPTCQKVTPTSKMMNKYRATLFHKKHDTILHYQESMKLLLLNFEYKFIFVWLTLMNCIFFSC